MLVASSSCIFSVSYETEKYKIKTKTGVTLAVALHGFHLPKLVFLSRPVAAGVGLFFLTKDGSRGTQSNFLIKQRWKYIAHTRTQRKGKLHLGP